MAKRSQTRCASAYSPPSHDLTLHQNENLRYAEQNEGQQIYLNIVVHECTSGGSDAMTAPRRDKGLAAAGFIVAADHPLPDIELLYPILYVH